MAKSIKPIGIIVLCVLALCIAMPLCMANPNRLEFSGRVTEDKIFGDTYSIGELHEGDKVKVVITDLRGNADLRVEFSDNPAWVMYNEFTFPGEFTFVAWKDGTYRLWMHCRPHEEGFSVAYRGYAEW